MHGTRINGRLIPKNDPIPLAHDDIISLGAEVRRGLDVYPECRFRVRYDIVPYKYVHIFHSNRSCRVCFS